MLELLEQQTSLTANQWKIFAASILSGMLDFFDFYLIGFRARLLRPGLASHLRCSPG